MASNNQFISKLPLSLQKLANYFGAETLRFLVVGGIGFGVNLAVLSLLYRVFEWSIVPSQLIAAEAAVLSNFFFHDNWTYLERISKSHDKFRIVKFHLTAWTGSGIISLVVILMVNTVHQNYLVGLVVASMVGLVWNFLWNRYFVWRGQKRQT